MIDNLLDTPTMPAAQRADIRQLAGQIALQTGDGAKVNRLLKLLDEFPDKLVVFTQCRATQQIR